MVYYKFLSSNNIIQAYFQFLLQISSAARIINPLSWLKDFNNFRIFTLIFPLNDFFIPSPGLIYIRGSTTQPSIKCLKLTIETLEQGVKYVQS